MPYLLLTLKDIHSLIYSEGQVYNLFVQFLVPSSFSLFVWVRLSGYRPFLVVG